MAATTGIRRFIFGETSVVSVPTALMRQGNFSELLNPSLTGNNPIQLVQPNSGSSAQKLSCNGQNNVLCPSQINPTAQKILSMYPLPNRSVNGVTTQNNYFNQRNATDNTTQFDIRMDYNASEKDQLFVRASYSNTPGSRAPTTPSLLVARQPCRPCDRQTLTRLA